MRINQTIAIFSRAFRWIGLAFILVGLVAWKTYQPHWTPPEDRMNSEYFDGTGLERFIEWASTGTILFSFGAYLRSRNEPASSDTASLRRRGIILMMLGVPLHFIPFLPIGGLCLLAGVIMFFCGAIRSLKTPSPRPLI